ncbi:hypothetical protein [Sphingopyxis fribergensis]
MTHAGRAREAGDRVDPPGGKVRSPLVIACFAWLAAVTVQFATQWRAIVALDFSDPDDAMRMAQVRDLLAGQGWWDLHQYRVNPADGGVLMHWSRIVDAPIALGVLILRPLFGQPVAEQLMMAFWPAMTAAILFLICTLAFRGLSDRRIAIGAPILMAASAPLMGQFRPLHIDHHGWQIIFAALILWQAIRPASRQAGIFAGLAGAALLAVSIEGLPIITLFAGLAAIRWALHARPEDRDRLIGMMGALAAGAALFQFATRGPASLVDSWCDALSPPYIAAFAAAFLPVAAMALRTPRTVALRIMILGIAGLLAAGALVFVAPQCASGPFASLDPVVVRFWYAHILEGRPVWLSGAMMTAAMIVPPLLGLVGSAMAWRANTDAAERRRWTVIFIALAGATMLALLVMRAGATAQVFALPGCVWLTLSAWTRARSLGSAPLRMAATAGALMTLPVTAAALSALVLQEVSPRMKTVDRMIFPANKVDQMCLKRDAVRALNTLPAGTVLTPLDLGGPMLFWTHHKLVATGHHRNNKAMADTINAFIGTADEAEALVRRREATLIVFCQTANDFRYYRTAGKNSLAQRLAAGNPPAWLEPLATGREYGLSVWRVKPE